jgi:hypothetical protein
MRGQIPAVPQCVLGLGGDRGQWGAQLMSELGGQSLFAAQAGCDPVQQPIKDGGQPGELVMGLTQFKSPIQISLAPCLGLSGHPPHRGQRARDQPVGCDGDGEQDQRREGDRGEQRGPHGLGAGPERDG